MQAFAPSMRQDLGALALEMTALAEAVARMRDSAIGIAGEARRISLSEEDLARCDDLASTVRDLPCNIRRGGRAIPCNWRAIPCNIKSNGV